MTSAHLRLVIKADWPLTVSHFLVNLWNQRLCLRVRVYTVVSLPVLSNTQQLNL